MTKTAKLTIFTGLFASLVVCLPYAAWTIQGAHHVPIYAEGQPAWVKIDEMHYAARVREFLDGTLIPTDVQLYEHKDDPGIRELLPIWIAGLTAHLMGSVRGAFILLDAVSPFLAIALAVSLFRLLGLSAGLSAAGSLILYFYFDASALQGLFDLIRHGTVAFDRPVIEMERFPSPQFTFPMLLLFLYGLLSYWNTAKTRWIVLTAVIQGLLFYTYFYYAVFTSLIMVGCILYAFFMKRTTALRYLLLAEIAALAIAAPYLLLLKQSAAAVSLSVITERFAVVHGHFLYKGVTLTYAVLGAILFIIPSKKHQKDWILLFGLTLGLALLNKQWFTGSNLHPMHWLNRVVHPWIILMAANTLAEGIKGNWKPRSRTVIKSATFAWLVFACLLSGLSAAKQWVYASAAGRYENPMNAETDVFAKLNGGEQPGVVLSVDLPFLKRLLIETGQDTYLPHFSGTLASDDEIEERLVLSAIIYGWTKEEWVSYISRDAAAVKLLRFIFGNRFVFELHRERDEEYRHRPEVLTEIMRGYKIYVPQNILHKWTALFDRFVTEKPLDLLSKYKIDSIVIRKEDPRWNRLNPSIAPLFSETLETSTYRVYTREPA